MATGTETVVVNDAALKRTLRSIERTFKDLTPFHKLVTTAGVKWVQENFQADGGKVGGWRPLKESTIRKRRKGSSRILRDSGLLLQSYARDSAASATEARVGSSREYSIHHEKGTRRVPQRRMLPNQAEALEQILRPTADMFMGRAIARSGA